MADRAVKCTRKTSETDIVLELNLDGKGDAKIDTGIGFFDHMLTSFAKHGFFDLNLTVKGDLYVDCHHTIEDTGIVLGKAIKGALGDKKSIKRFGNFFLPMDYWYRNSRKLGISSMLVPIWNTSLNFLPSGLEARPMPRARQIRSRASLGLRV